MFLLQGTWTSHFWVAHIFFCCVCGQDMIMVSCLTWVYLIMSWMLLAVIAVVVCELLCVHIAELLPLRVVWRGDWCPLHPVRVFVLPPPVPLEVHSPTNSAVTVSKSVLEALWWHAQGTKRSKESKNFQITFQFIFFPTSSKMETLYYRIIFIFFFHRLTCGVFFLSRYLCNIK